MSVFVLCCCYHFLFNIAYIWIDSQVQHVTVTTVAKTTKVVSASAAPAVAAALGTAPTATATAIDNAAASPPRSDDEEQQQLQRALDESAEETRCRSITRNQGRRALQG